MNEGLGIFFDQFGNPIRDLVGGDFISTPPIISDEPLPSPQDIAISEGARILTETINSGVGVDVVNQGEGEQFIREGILAGNPGVVQDIVANKINNLDDSAKGAIASQAFGVFNPALAQLAAANQVNQGIQVAGDFVQSGIGTLQDRMDPESFGFGALDRTSNIIEGVQNISGDVVGSANRIVGDLIVNPLGQVIGRVNRGIINPIFGPIQDFGLSLIGRDDDINPRRADRPVVVIDPNAVSQTFTTGGGSTPPPVVVTDTQKPYESGVGQQTGQTGGPAGMGFAPPPPSDNPTGFGSNIRIGKAEGGLATIPRYLKGR